MKTIVSTVAVVLLVVFGLGSVPAEVEVSGGYYVAYFNGDLNASGSIDISDAVHLLNWLFLGTAAHPAPMYCEPLNRFHNGDVNGSGANRTETPDLADAICILQYLFLGGPAPVDACPSV
jgi:hypothetical protein